VSDHLIAEANRHAEALPKMALPTTKPNDRDLSWYIAECIDLKKQLEMECAAKREHMRIACAEINELKVKAGFYEREIARLRADKERLDWLAVTDVWFDEPATESYTPETFRAEIDRKRKEAQP
jgi:uncharacterized coiled-coil DUF342 family protein